MTWSHLSILVAVWSGLALPGFAAEQQVQSPVDARQTADTFEIHPQFRLELVACEPAVVDPVAIAFDEHGNLWVVEMRDYPNGPEPGQPFASRIRILRDDDDDGFFESSSVFAENLPFANGLLPFHGPDTAPNGQPVLSVIVTVSGRVQFMSDTDGDRRADVVETWFEGFAEENPQLRANDPTLGPDGWVYVANGLRNGTVKAVRPAWQHHAPVTLRGTDFRFHPQTGACEAVSGLGQFGMSFDDAGNRFVCSNRNPCNHVLLPQRFLNRNPLLVRTETMHVVSPAGADSRVFAISRPWTTSTLHAGQFTAACGVTIYRGNTFPQGWRGNSFTCEPTGNLVHRDVLIQDGPTFRSRPGRSGVEFLASRDNWFRPVNLANGPDGNLYVVDMYRAVIEHPQFMPTELKQRGDLTLGSDRGRIYRIVTLNPRSASDLPDGWHMDMQRRRATLDPATTFADPVPPTHPRKQARARYLELLELGDRTNDGAALDAAVAMYAEHPAPATAQALLTFPAESAPELLKRLVAAAGNDLVIPDLCLQIALADHDAQTLDALRLVLPLRSDLRVAAIDGLATGVQRRRKRLLALGDQLDPQVRQQLQELLDQAASDTVGGTQSERLAGIRLLVHADAAQAVPPLLQAAAANSGQVPVAAIDALARFQSAAVARTLLQDFDRRTPAVQRAIVRSCIARPGSAQVFVEAVLAKQVPVTAIDAAAQRRLRAYTQEPLKKLVAQALAALTPADRVSVLREYQRSLQLAADPRRGRTVFEKNCATCHRIGQLGTDIGPDIADSRTRTPEYLLTNILDPNRAVDANFFSYTAVLDDGRILTGLIAAETSASVTLRQPEGKTITLLREDIDVLRSDGVSLMPAGLEKNINPQQMADLISFVKNWRYLDGDIPIPVP